MEIVFNEPHNREDYYINSGIDSPALNALTGAGKCNEDSCVTKRRSLSPALNALTGAGKYNEMHHVANNGFLVMPVFGKNELPDYIQSSLKTFIVEKIREEESFEGKIGQTVVMQYPEGKNIVLLGVGKKEELDKKSIRSLGVLLHKALVAEGVTEVSIAAPIGWQGSSGALAANLADAMLEESYNFKQNKIAGDPELEKVKILTMGDSTFAKKTFDSLRQNAKKNLQDTESLHKSAVPASTP